MSGETAAFWQAASSRSSFRLARWDRRRCSSSNMAYPWRSRPSCSPTEDQPPRKARGQRADGTGAVQLSGINIPALSTRRAETTIELGSGESFAIGGLLQNSSNNNGNSLPGLGDLPSAGRLVPLHRFPAKRDRTGDTCDALSRSARSRTAGSPVRPTVTNPRTIQTFCPWQRCAPGASPSAAARPPAPTATS